ncbi:MAG: hypothetical protein J4O03_12400 [Chloroflexi bacterium]|nr:hypothetical protein [Chloroflexota bacterium]MCH8351480.1 hypothetical protein [Chloroflexota bacterium]MCI0782378.1 hypothetical protein [Chloroflexota bacterium]MCI0786991.1 hypothetical protein [Chloroflexota bacterium]MCI0794256.1 hypothetical protein [Chloroflexota bacterium]
MESLHVLAWFHRQICFVQLAEHYAHLRREYQGGQSSRELIPNFEREHVRDSKDRIVEP